MFTRATRRHPARNKATCFACQRVCGPRFYFAVSFGLFSFIFFRRRVPLRLVRSLLLRFSVGGLDHSPACLRVVEGTHNF